LPVDVRERNHIDIRESVVAALQILPWNIEGKIVARGRRNSASDH
jgi:hypothetical protein